MSDDTPEPRVDINKARSIRSWRTELRDNPDGEPLSVERVGEQEHALGSTGTAAPCCDASEQLPADEHEVDCPYARGGAREANRQEVNEALRNWLNGRRGDDDDEERDTGV